MSQSASEPSITLQARPSPIRRSSVFWLGGVAGVMFAACATYESPAMLGYGSAYAGPESSGGSSAGTASVTGGNAPSSSGTMPMAGTPAMPTGNAGSGGVAGSAPASGGGGGAGGAAAGGGAAGAAAGSGGAGGTAAACAECANLAKALVHRYDFEGAGAVVTDRVGTAHGSVQGGGMLATLDGKGVVNLGGGTAGAYVDLPNGLLSSLTSATLEAWVTWAGGDPWQRVFDFGDSNDAQPEDHPANGKSYLFLTPMTDVNSGGAMRAVYSLSGGAAAAETRVEGAQAMPQSLSQVALVVDASAGKLSLYLDGVFSGEQTFTGALSSINDVNVWLGRSQYNVDVEFGGTFHDFRMYDAALTAPQIAASFAAGPDPAFLAE